MRAFCGSIHVCAGVLLLIVALGTSLAEEPWPNDVPTIAEQARNLLQDRNYGEAIAAIDEAAAAQDAPKDYLAYLKGRALTFAGDFAAAVTAFDEMATQYPESRWARRARFGKAIALARKGDFRPAELIYREEAEWLLGAERRDEIAQIYLDFADAYFKPPKKQVDPDYTKAFHFYEKAIEAGPKPERQVEIEMRMAICQQELGDLQQAAHLYATFSEKHPDSPQDIEARYRLGECQLKEDLLKEARRTWEDLLAAYPDNDAERIAEAAFRLSRTWRLPEPLDDEDLSRGVASLESFLKRFPAHELAGQAYLDICKSYLLQDQADKVVPVLGRFLADPRYAERKEIADARAMLAEVYEAQRKFPEALAAWREYFAAHPAHKMWQAGQQQVVEIEFQMGMERFEAKDYSDARIRWSEFMAKYPLDSRNAKILYCFGQIEYEQEKWDEAIAAWRNVLSKYPDSPSAAESQLQIARTLELKLGRFEDAIEEYRIVSTGSEWEQAAQAIARLTSKSLTVSTERVFRTDEPPQIKLATRNIDSVSVRVYPIDLETYFRKMHQAAGIESLDISLIDPASTFKYEVPGYAEYQEFERSIEVPMTGDTSAGAMAVTVTSDTLEATTLVIRSDLDVIIKTSRDEVFVFAENMRTTKAWPDVRLLISDGKQVFAEATTGADGVFQKAYLQLKDIDDVRVFAIADGHVASNVVGLSGLNVARGLSDKGYIYTDQPAYRAGDTVCLRGCIRRAIDDRYVIEPGRRHTVSVFDTRDRLLHQENVKLGAFGSFDMRVPLPPVCPQGDYRVQVDDGLGHTYQGMFRVDEYEIEPVRLIVETPRRVYYRGEKIEGTIRAAYYYGAPLANCEIRYQLADERTYTVRTDEKGEVSFRLDTRDFAESQLLSLVVTLPDRNLQVTQDFVLATQGFSIDVTSARPVYVAGESFEATVRTSDAAGQAVGRKLSLTVLRRTTADYKVSERAIESHEIQTTDADGVARQTLTIAEGGDYVIRAEGTDRFGNPIWAEMSLIISGEEDETRLRILADRHTYKAGDTAEVTLLWREQPALALVTYQGARVLGYRLVELATGANRLELPMTSELAPNFDLEAAVMIDCRPRGDESDERKAPRRFHPASSWFAVERDLNVSISLGPEGKQETAEPGEEIQVTLTTTDPQGKPVPAELSLAMVEDALLDRFKWPAPPIAEFFGGLARETAVRTMSSITFDYHPTTRPIDPRLLSEEDRLEVARQEAADRQRIAQGSAGGMMGSGMGGMGGGMGGIGGLSYESAAGAPFAPSGSTETFDPAQLRADLSLFPDHQGDRPGGKMADFDSLISLITTSVGPDAPQETEVRPPTPSQSESRPDILPAAGYWNPAIVTGEDGRAVVRFRVPDRSTAWTLVAKGITGDIKDDGAKAKADGSPRDLFDVRPGETLAGEANAELLVRGQLFGQLKLPQAFTVGDETQVLATVHNRVVEEGPIEVILSTTIDGRSVEQKKTIAKATQGISELSFPVSLAPPEAAANAKKTSGDPTAIAFELTVSAGERRSVLRRSVPLRPYGVPVFASAGGVAQSDTTAWIEQPDGMNAGNARLRIAIGSTVEASLFDAVLSSSPWHGVEFARPDADIESTASDLMAALSLQTLLDVTREAGEPQAAALDRHIHASVTSLVSCQSDGGGWSWAGGGDKNDAYVSARVCWAMTLAREAGYSVPDESMNKVVSYLANRLLAAADDDFETKAVLLHALTLAGKPDFSLVNRLYRQRPSLSEAALVYVSLTLAAMDRKEMGRELLELLGKRDLDLARLGPCGGTPLELHALYALAIQEVSPGTPLAEAQVDWLLAHRVGERWSPDKATGPAVAALCRWFAKSRFEGERYRLTIEVNDVAVADLEIDPASGTRWIEVPSTAIHEGKQRIHFGLTGRGRYAYQCLLSGVVPAESASSTTTAWSIARAYEPAPLEIEGRAVPRGFDVVEGPHKQFRNSLTELPEGRRAIVTLALRRQPSTAVGASEADYLVVSEPIPAGTAVIESSVDGDFDRYEIVPGAIKFYVGNRGSLDRSRATASAIRYQLHGYLPGSYRVGPTVVRNAYRPDRMALALPKTLAVPPSGQHSADPYRLTPQELFALGQRAFDQGDWATAEKHLTELLDQWNLRSGVYRDAVKMLLDVHLKLGPPAQVVRFFETIVEKWPSEEIPFDKSLAIAAAYHAIGEFERSYLSYRATVEASFGRDGAVAGFLDSEDEFLRSVDVMNRLLREYPPEAYAAAARYRLAHRVDAKAPQAASDARLRDAGISRVDLVHRAATMFETFLTEHPDDPAADQAAFSRAAALVRLEAFDQAIVDCRRYATRYPNSKLLDTFWYIIGYSQFATGQHEAALETCRRVAEATRVDSETGRKVPSRNKWQAIYIMGQIYHSLGRAAEAVGEYRLVADRFDDARKSIAYFLRKEISLPEVTTIRPGEAVEVELAFRNLATCEVRVYRIDLMKYGLLRGGLGGFSAINLAGIRPLDERTVELGDGRDYRDRTKTLSLPMTDEGAYLVVCRGEDLHAGGLVLITPLDVEVQTDATADQVRAIVKDAVANRYLDKVDVKVIGTGNRDFVSGRTDLRGIFVAEGIEGRPTVLADAGSGRYAFARSGGPLAGPMLSAVTLSSGSIGTPSQSEAVLMSGNPSENERRIFSALDSPTRFDFTEQPLSDAIDYLKKYHGIEIQLDQKALDDVGLAGDTPVTRKLHGISLRSALKLLLRDLDLTFQVRDEVLLITTPEEAEAELTTVSYPVTDLVRFRNKSGEEWTDYDSLIDMITTTIQPTSWDTVGGPGAITPLRVGDADVITLSQTQEAHREIASLLATMRALGGLKGENGELTVREKQEYDANGNGPFGGMGGGFGGMGAGQAMPSSQAAPANKNDLLQGLNEASQQFQSEQLQQMKRSNQGGMGGVGAGGFF